MSDDREASAIMKKTTYRGIEKKQARWGVAFVVPSVLFFCLFSFYPIINAMFTSLFDKRILSLTAPKFLGLGNYIYIFKSASFWNSMRATLVFTLGTFIPLLVFSLMFATFIYNICGRRSRGFFQIAYYTPAVLSSVVAAAIWLLILAPPGLGNQVLNWLCRTPGVDRKWLANGTMLQFSTMLVYFWKYIGYFVILFITGLATIPPTIYEAATIDGSSKWQSFWRITVPLLKPTILLVSVMAMLQCLKTFSTQYLFTQSGGAAQDPINVITLNIYETGIRNQRIGRASAMSIVLFVIMLVLTFAQFKISKSDDVDY